MGESTAWAPGRFVWHELITTDFEASRAFYGELFQWSIRELSVGAGAKYATLHAGATPVGGLALRDPQDPRPCAWVGYVSVPDVDRAAHAAATTGGGILVPPLDLPGIGRLTVLLDPGGAPITAWRANGGDVLPDDPLSPGLFCWDELAVHDADPVGQFYERVFGWARAPYGAGAMWLLYAGPMQVASLVANPGTGAHWLSHVVVDNLERARDRAMRLGAAVWVAEQVVPGSGRFSVLSDNVGARLALFEPRVAPV